MTIPRDLKLKQAGDIVLVASTPSQELMKIQSKPVSVQNLKVGKRLDLSTKIGTVSMPCRIDLNMDNVADLSIVLSNDMNEQVVIGFDRGANQYYVDRTKSGKVDFHKDFAARHAAPRFTKDNKMDMTLVIDVASVELFADDGLSVMTEIFFPNKPFNKIQIQSADGAVIKKLDYIKLTSTLK